jgi:hypothetical protein
MWSTILFSGKAASRLEVLEVKKVSNSKLGMTFAHKSISFIEDVEAQVLYRIVEKIPFFVLCGD